MSIHLHARMTVHGRALLVNRILVERWRVADVAAAANVSEWCAYTWLARFRAGGERMLHDRDSAPARPKVRVTPASRAPIEA